MHGRRFLIRQFDDFHEAFDGFACFDELCLILGNEERTLDAGHPIEACCPVWVATESMIAQDIVDFHIAMSVGFRINECLNQPTVAFCFGVGSS